MQKGKEKRQAFVVIPYTNSMLRLSFCMRYDLFGVKKKKEEEQAWNWTINGIATVETMYWIQDLIAISIKIVQFIINYSGRSFGTWTSRISCFHTIRRLLFGAVFFFFHKFSAVRFACLSYIKQWQTKKELLKSLNLAYIPFEMDVIFNVYLFQTERKKKKK